MSESPLALRAVDLRKRFGHREALRGLTLQVRCGELFGLLGPNGAGKTTFLSIANGLTSGDTGDVFVFGERLSPDARRLRTRIGLATQDLAVYPELTAAENLRFFGKLYGVRGNVLEDRVAEVLVMMALADRAGDRVAGFSGGMKRRLNLGMAIMHRPELLFLDEPTTGVDPQSRWHIFEQIRHLNSTGVTIVYTSHVMDEVEALCERVAIMDFGNVVACDSVASLLATLPTRVTLTWNSLPAAAAPPEWRVESPTTWHYDGAEASRHLTAALAGADPATPPKIEWHTPTLEQVFMGLTSRAIRDDV